MPPISPIDLASFVIANTPEQEDTARALLLQSALGANSSLIAAKLITDQLAALQQDIAGNASDEASPDEAIATLEVMIAALTRQLAELNAALEQLKAQQSQSRPASRRRRPAGKSVPGTQPDSDPAPKAGRAALLVRGRDPRTRTPKT